MMAFRAGLSRAEGVVPTSRQILTTIRCFAARDKRLTRYRQILNKFLVVSGPPYKGPIPDDWSAIG